MANKTYFKGKKKSTVKSKKYQFAGFDEATQIDNTGYLNALYNPKYFDKTGNSEVVSREASKNIESNKNIAYNTYQSSNLATNTYEDYNRAIENQRKQSENAKKELQQKTKAESLNALNTNVIQSVKNPLLNFGKELVKKQVAKQVAKNAAVDAAMQSGTAGIWQSTANPTTAALTTAQSVTGSTVPAGVEVAANTTQAAATAGTQGAINATTTAGSSAAGLSSAAYSGIAALGTLAGEGWKYLSNDQDPGTYTKKEKAGTIGGTILSRMSTGAGIGATAGSLIAPGVGTGIGALIGGAAGAVEGTVEGLIKNKKFKRQAEEIKRQEENERLEYLDAKRRNEEAYNKQLRLYNYTRNKVKNDITYQSELLRQNRLMGLTEGQLAGNTNIAMTGGGRKYFGKGGVNVPGGQVVPIGQGAVEFVGRKHSQGGIMLDPQTEVEGGETMDKVMMTGGKFNDYFFSDYLKNGGKSFAQHHKELIKRGASQEEIQALAKKQEATANRKGEKDRSPNQVAKYGGLRKYQTAGPSTGPTVDIIGYKSAFGFPYPLEPYQNKNKLVTEKDVEEYNAYLKNNQGKRNIFYDTHDLIQDKTGNYSWQPKRNVDYQSAIQGTPLGQMVYKTFSHDMKSLDQFDNQHYDTTGLEMGYSPYNIWASPSAGIGFYDKYDPGNILNQVQFAAGQNAYPTIYFLNNTDNKTGDFESWYETNKIYDPTGNNLYHPDLEQKTGMHLMNQGYNTIRISDTEFAKDPKYIKTFGYDDDLLRIVNPNVNVAGALPLNKRIVNKLERIEKRFDSKDFDRQLKKEERIKKMLLRKAGIPRTEENLKTLMHYNFTPLNVYSEINKPGYKNIYSEQEKTGGVRKYQTGKFKLGKVIGTTENNSVAPQSFNDINKIIPMPKNPTPEEGEAYWDAVRDYCAKFPGTKGVCFDNREYFDENGHFSMNKFKKFPYHVQAYLAARDPGGGDPDPRFGGKLEAAGFPARYERPGGLGPGKTTTFLVDTPEEIEDYMKKSKELDLEMKNFDKNYGPSTWVKSNKLGGIKKYQTGNFLGKEIEDSNSTNSVYWNNPNINTEEEIPSKSQTLDTLDAKKEGNEWVVRDEQGNILGKSMDRSTAEAKAQNAVIIANQKKNESTTQKGNTAAPSNSKFGPYKNVNILNDNVNILNDFGALGRYVTNPNQVPYKKGMNAAAYRGLNSKAKTGKLTFTPAGNLTFTSESTTAAQPTNTTKNPPANSKFGPYKNLLAYKIQNNFGALGFKSTNNNSKDAPKDNKEDDKKDDKKDAYSKMYSPEQIKTAKILAGIGFGSQMIAPISSIFMKPNLVSAPTPIVPGMIDTAAAKSVAPMISAGKVEAPRLGRVTPETEDIMNRDVANRQFFSNIGDPSSMIAMIASTGKTNEAERKAIADAQRTNVELAGKEGMLKFEASKANVASSLEAQRANQAAINEAQGRYLNVLSKNQEMKNQAYLANLDARTKTRLANAQLLADKQNRDIAAMSTFGTNVAGGVGDFLSYGIEGEKSRMASGDTGVYERNFIPIFGTKDKDGNKKTGGVKKKMYGGTNSYTSRLGDLKFKRALKVK